MSLASPIFGASNGNGNGRHRRHGKPAGPPKAKSAAASAATTGATGGVATAAAATASAAAKAPAPSGPAAGRRPAPSMLSTWLRAQAINVTRHAGALRPFRRDEFGTGVAAPTEAHVGAVNDLIGGLRRRLIERTRRVNAAVRVAVRRPTPAVLQATMARKAHAHRLVQAVERVWDFYFELFGQRQTRFGEWLVACDRIALDCYQYVYLNLGTARSIPTPPPFSYMRTGFSPATFRRNVPLRRLGLQLNPFPLIQLPYHRLVNPWTLGAILHEVSHNLQNDLGLARDVPRSVARRLLDAGLGRSVAATWVRWNREAFADMAGLLLGGPAVVGSLLDVIARDRRTVLNYAPAGPHPTPYVRAYLSIELLRRMGFEREAEQYRRVWSRIFPDGAGGTIPPRVLQTAHRANAVVVDAVCYTPFPSLGNRTLAQVMRFEQKEQRMIEEAARRLAAGVDPGVIPERFLIGAAREALDRRLARPGVITQNFYSELARR